VDIQTKDGILLRGIPEGTPDDVIKARIEKIRAEKPSAAPASEVPMSERRNIRGESVDPSKQFSIPEWMLSMASTGIGTTRGAMNLVGEGYDKLFGQKKLSDLIAPQEKKGWGTEFLPPAGDPSSAAGILGNFIDPASWAVAGGIGKVLPFVPLLAKGASGIPGQLARNVASGAVTGGALGALSDEGDAATGAAWGAGMGAVLPPVLGGAARAAKAIKEVAYPSPGRLGVKAAGEKADDVIAAMMQTKSGVPGVNLTAGQASVPANSAEFAALQNTVAKEDPSRFYGPAGVKGQQAAARQAAVRDIGRTPQDLADAMAARKAVSDVNYGEAYKVAINADPDLAKIASNPYFKDEVPEAFRLAKAAGLDPKKNLTQFLQFVKEGLDARIQALSGPNPPAISNSTKKAIGDVKGQLVEWLGNKNKLYDIARTEHAAMSKPINQMKAGQEIEQALVAPATSAERASSFGTKMREMENKISKATGKPRMEDLTSTQQKVLSAIGEDFERNASFKDLASSGAKNLEDRIGTPEIKSFGIFNPFLSFLRGRINQVLGTGHEKALTKLAPIMEKPDQMALLMRAATPKQRAAIEAMFAQRMTRGAIIGANGILGQPSGVLDQQQGVLSQ